MKDISKPLIFDLSLKDLEDWMIANGQPAFRAKQIWVAIYQNFKLSAHEITTLPLELRQKLEETFTFQVLNPVKTIQSEDGQTQKNLFRLGDGHLIEAVLMYYDNRRTLCISSQSGCAMGCAFCATGQMGFQRNLTSGEIIAQVLFYARQLSAVDDRVTNIVVMGMGEPFHNYDHVMEALNRLNDPQAFGLGARRFTISTVGLVPRIKQFADENTQYNLAISLHTVDNDLRVSMMPISKKYPVSELMQACRYYVQRTNRRLTFEYALIDGINDSPEAAEALSKTLRGMICHVNLIPLNPTDAFKRQGSGQNSVQAFADVLIAHNIPVTVRMRRGIEIQAGCGQLAAEVKPANPKPDHDIIQPL